METSGPLALAGSIGQTGKTVTQDGFGFNINGFGTGRQAARTAAKPATAVAPAPSGPAQKPSSAGSPARARHDRR